MDAHFQIPKIPHISAPSHRQTKKAKSTRHRTIPKVSENPTPKYQPTPVAVPKLCPSCSKIIIDYLSPVAVYIKDILNLVSNQTLPMQSGSLVSQTAFTESQSQTETIESAPGAAIHQSETHSKHSNVFVKSESVGTVSANKPTSNQSKVDYVWQQLQNESDFESVEQQSDRPLSHKLNKVVSLDECKTDSTVGPQNHMSPKEPSEASSNVQEPKAFYVHSRLSTTNDYQRLNDFQDEDEVKHKFEPNVVQSLFNETSCTSAHLSDMIPTNQTEMNSSYEPIPIKSQEVNEFNTEPPSTEYVELNVDFNPVNNLTQSEQLEHLMDNWKPQVDKTNEPEYFEYQTSPYAYVTIVNNNLSAVNAILLANSLRFYNNQLLNVLGKSDFYIKRIERQYQIPIVVLLCQKIDVNLHNLLEQVFDEVGHSFIPILKY